jgi:prepilin-type N-terminal cleavage/methylation domain-containing protein
MKPKSRKAARAAFTLTELMVALVIAGVATAAMSAFFMGASKLATKNTFAANVITDVRLGAEYLSAEIVDARSPVILEDPSEDGTTFGRVVYTKNVGLPGVIRSAQVHDPVVVLSVDGQTWPSAGDELSVAGVNTTRPAVIQSVEDPRPGLSDTGAGPAAEIRIRLRESLFSLGAPAGADLSAGTSAFVSRRRAFAVVPKGDTLALGWFSQADAAEPSMYVAHNIAIDAVRPFSAVSFESATSGLSAVAYRLEVQADRPAVVSMLGGRRETFARSILSGVVAPQSRDTALLGALPVITLTEPEEDSDDPKDDEDDRDDSDDGRNDPPPTRGRPRPVNPPPPPDTNDDDMTMIDF